MMKNGNYSGDEKPKYVLFQNLHIPHFIKIDLVVTETSGSKHSHIQAFAFIILIGRADVWNFVLGGARPLNS